MAALMAAQFWRRCRPVGAARLAALEAPLAVDGHVLPERRTATNYNQYCLNDKKGLERYVPCVSDGMRFARWT